MRKVTLVILSSLRIVSHNEASKTEDCPLFVLFNTFIILLK